MALRRIRLEGDPILRKKSRPIDEINDRIQVLLDDMVETMRDAEGVGLAAPQVGVLRRAVVIDVGEGPIKIINPEIIDEEGTKIDIEGCLSVPNKAGKVERPERVKIKYINEDGEEVILEGEGLLAKAICHEIDHLDGILYTDKVIEYVDLTAEEDEETLEEEEES
ncbi:MAG: peptide deformylase [Tissierellaceae bacterium]|jgi:peptide deformylase|nr:peptide deformylase [Tissierellia bacterium]